MNIYKGEDLDLSVIGQLSLLLSALFHLNVLDQADKAQCANIINDAIGEIHDLTSGLLQSNDDCEHLARRVANIKGRYSAVLSNCWSDLSVSDVAKIVNQPRSNMCYMKKKKPLLYKMVEKGCQYSQFQQVVK